MHYPQHRILSPALPLTGVLLLTLCCALPFASRAEKVAVSLSQEQEGGDAGRACIYVYKGKAEFRKVKAGESCPSEIMIESEKP